MIDVAATGPQVAFTLLHFCGSFCRFRELARSTPTNLVLDAFKLFNNDIHHCFMACIVLMRHGVRPSLASTGVV